jgi:hypothetical protein
MRTWPIRLCQMPIGNSFRFVGSPVCFGAPDRMARAGGLVSGRRCRAVKARRVSANQRRGVGVVTSRPAELAGTNLPGAPGWCCGPAEARSRVRLPRSRRPRLPFRCFFGFHAPGRARLHGMGSCACLASSCGPACRGPWSPPLGLGPTDRVPVSPCGFREDFLAL